MANEIDLTTSYKSKGGSDKTYKKHSCSDVFRRKKPFRKKKTK